MELSESPSVRAAADREQVLSRLRERIVAFAASRLSRDVAEDLAQEVLLLIHEKYGEVERLEELVPLCLRIVRYKMMDFHRKAGRRGERTQRPLDSVPLADPEPGPEALAARQEIGERLAAAVKRLGPRCKELLRLKLAGRTFSEIQVVLGAASINTVYTWDHRCRERLLALMGGSWEGREK
jgi:RNA polymerase sigma-70 factor (ECF subfamily)